PVFQRSIPEPVTHRLRPALRRRDVAVAVARDDELAARHLGARAREREIVPELAHHHRDLAPALRVAADVRFGVEHRRKAPEAQHGEHRQKRQRHQQLDEREAARFQFPSLGSTATSLRSSRDDSPGVATWTSIRRNAGCGVDVTSMRHGNSMPAWRSEPSITPSWGQARRAASSATRFSATKPASTRSFTSVAEVVDSATARAAAASAIAAIASATTSSTSVKPLERDAPKCAAPQDDLRAARADDRLERRLQSVRHQRHRSAVDRNRAAERARVVRTLLREALPLAFL